MPSGREIALFPLNTVLFPGGLLPLRIFEQRYLGMAKGCLRDGAPFGVCLIREGGEVGAPATPEPVGCLARIVQWDMPQLGLLQVVARGEQRFRIAERRVQADGLALATVAELPEGADAAVPERLIACQRVLERIAAKHPDLFERPLRLESCAWVSARLAEVLPLPLAEKQKLLETGTGLERLERVYRLLAKQE
jgi:hypothetical protein